MFHFPFSQHSSIQLVSVDLGVKKVLIPVADIQGSRAGKTLFITAGMDGDEYAGMQAAYQLIDLFQDKNFAGRLVVIPVVNIPGFEAECSQNPLDQIFPKMIFPGSAHGRPTERLVNWLIGQANGSDAWIDLHGGAITEGLNPFLWVFEAGIPDIDRMVQQFYRASGAQTVVSEWAGKGSKAGELARNGCAYILAESGSRGGRASSDVERHVSWVKQLMTQLHMLEAEQATNIQTSDPLRHVSCVYAPFAGIWRPENHEREIKKGAVLGQCTLLDGTSEKIIYAPTSGTSLWWKETFAMRKGDVLMAIGYR